MAKRKREIKKLLKKTKMLYQSSVKSEKIYNNLVFDKAKQSSYVNNSSTKFADMLMDQARTHTDIKDAKKRLIHEESKEPHDQLDCIFKNLITQSEIMAQRLEHDAEKITKTIYCQNKLYIQNRKRLQLK